MKDVEHEGKAPWMKFYTADWRADSGLRSCKNAARGLWIDLLSLMHESDEYGYLFIAGKQPTAKVLSRILGGGTEREYREQLAELEEANVFSRRADGAIYSRRMVQDLKKSQRFKEFGKRGGNPILKSKGEPPLNPNDGIEDKARVNPNHNPKLNGEDKLHTRVTRGQSLESKKEAAATLVQEQTPREPELQPEPLPLPRTPVQMPRLCDPPSAWLCVSDKRENDDSGVAHPVISGRYVDIVAKEVCEAARINLASWRGNWQPVLVWLKLNIDVHDVIIPTVKRVASRPGYPCPPPHSLKFFHAAVLESAGIPLEDAA